MREDYCYFSRRVPIVGFFVVLLLCLKERSTSEALATSKRFVLLDENSLEKQKSVIGTTSAVKSAPLQYNADTMKKNNMTAGLIHLGKTGGSSLTAQLRNGCHSFIKKPCKKVSNETIVSELVTNYYHSE